MSVHIQRHLDKIKRMILSLGGEVERSLELALEAVESRDSDTARALISNDDVIDQLEIDVEEACLHVLALEQPVAMDLRFLVAVLKMNNDLERIGDISANIAEQVCLLAEKPWIDVSPLLAGMGDEVRTMLRSALDSLLELDPDAAERVRQADDRVDALHRRTFERVENEMRSNPDRFSELLHVLSISRNLERAADLATNIAEDVIFLVRGKIQRHQETKVLNPRRTSAR